MYLTIDIFRNELMSSRVLELNASDERGIQVCGRNLESVILERKLQDWTFLYINCLGSGN